MRCRVLKEGKVPLDGDAASRLTAAAAEAASWGEVASQLREDFESTDPDELRWLVWAFEYSLESLQVRRSGSPFEPMLGFNDGSSYPPTVDAVEDAVLQAWSEAADSDGPVIASRLHDLLWERREGDAPHLHARAAWLAYMELAEGSWDSIHRAASVLRALQLARSLNDGALLGKTVTVAAALVRAALAVEDPSPGAPLRVLAALVELPSDVRPEDLDELLGLAEDVFRHDPHLYESVVQLKMELITCDPDLTDLRIGLVNRWLETADRDKGLGRFAHLRHALELAEAYGLTERAGAIRKLIQDGPPASDEFEEISLDLKIPRAELEDYVAELVGNDGWQAALTRVGGMSPPSGDYGANLARVSRQKAEHPLMFLVTKVIYGPLGFPVQVVQDEGLHERVALSENERYGMEVAGLVLGQVLDGIKEKYGVPSPEELTTFFTAAFIPEETAERVAAALLHYWAGNLDECVHVLCPRVEATLRTGFMKVGMTIISLPQGDRPGGVRVLGELLREAFELDVMRDPSRTRYLYNLLCDPYGMNLRNNIAHGLLTRARGVGVAPLLWTVEGYEVVGSSEAVASIFS
jgi:hypothetical protein